MCVRALNSTDVVDHLNKVSDVKPTLHSWDKAHLYVDRFGVIVLEDFHVHTPKRYQSVVFYAYLCLVLV